MVKYNQVYLLSFMAKLLHPTKEVESYYFPCTQLFWNHFVRIGSNHLVLPALYAALVRKKLFNHVPKDLLEYLKEISQINKKRNDSILNQIVFLDKIFKKNKIEHVFLKGAAMLILEPYDAVNERMIGDIDILISERDLLKAQKLLIDKGFKATDNEFNFVSGITSKGHLKRIASSSYIAAVELHKNLLDNKKIIEIESEEVLKFKVKTKNGYYIPSNSHLWLHAIFNWQYMDYGLIYNSFSLRTYVDVVHLESNNIDHCSLNNTAVNHFYSLCSVLVDGYKNRNFISSLIFKFQLLYPKFERLIKLQAKFKIILSIIFSRLTLFFKSKKYRYRLFNNPKLLMNRIFNFWKKI